MSLHFREQLANSLCVSRLKFGVDTWLCTTTAATAQIHNVRMRIGSGLIGKNELHWLPTDLFVKKGRLSSLAKLCKGGSSGRRFAEQQSNWWDDDAKEMIDNQEQEHETDENLINYAGKEGNGCGEVGHRAAECSKGGWCVKGSKGRGGPWHANRKGGGKGMQGRLDDSRGEGVFRVC